MSLAREWSIELYLIRYIVRLTSTYCLSLSFKLMTLKKYGEIPQPKMVHTKHFSFLTYMKNILHLTKYQRMFQGH
jgi:hypothetical protein